MPRGSGNPANKLKEIPADVIQSAMQFTKEIQELPEIITDEDVKKNVAGYFGICERYGERPGIEGLSLSLHVTRKTVYLWAQGVGCSCERANTVRQAKQAIATVLESAGYSGKINPICYVWLCKNWLGYQDSISISAQAEESIQNTLHAETPEEIYEKYKDQIDTSRNAEMPMLAPLPDYEENEPINPTTKGSLTNG